MLFAFGVLVHNICYIIASTLSGHRSAAPAASGRKTCHEEWDGPLPLMLPAMRHKRLTCRFDYRVGLSAVGLARSAALAKKRGPSHLVCLSSSCQTEPAFSHVPAFEL